MKVIIDRFEGNFAVVELPDQEMVNMPRQLVPMEAVEGDVINIRLDQDESKKRKNNINKLMDDLFE